MATGQRRVLLVVADDFGIGPAHDRRHPAPGQEGRRHRVGHAREFALCRRSGCRLAARGPADGPRLASQSDARRPDPAGRPGAEPRGCRRQVLAVAALLAPLAARPAWSRARSRRSSAPSCSATSSWSARPPAVVNAHQHIILFPPLGPIILDVLAQHRCFP